MSAAATDVVVVDYGAGNVGSVRRALEAVGAAPRLSADPREVRSARHVVVPGVGAFPPAMEALVRCGLADAIREAAASGAALLGICLGMQLLFDESDEHGTTAGLGLLPGRVERLPAGIRTPHIGWNSVTSVGDTPLLRGIPDGEMFYFVHSYVVPASAPDTLAVAGDGGFAFAALAGRGSVAGVQFHPEKSDRAGLRLLSNFLGQEPGRGTS